MEYECSSIGAFFDERLVEDGSLDEFNSRWERARIAAAREIVQDSDRSAEGIQDGGEVRADESSAAGYQHMLFLERLAV